MKQRKSGGRLVFGLILLAVLGAGLFFGWNYIKAFYLTGVPKNAEKIYVCIPTGADFDEVVDILLDQGLIDDEGSFRWLSQKMNYKKAVMRAGRFEVKPGWTTRELILHLRSGEQAPVKVILNNERLLEEVAGKVARFIEADSAALIRTFTSKNFLREIGYTEQTLMTIFIPNTYEMYWNTDAKGFVERMMKEQENFWSKNGRRAAAQKADMTEEEVYTLASIVERETNYNPEKPTIAGVYLNRLKINMKLQADPTCVFATRDFGTRRVTNWHINYDSPYNTYLYTGLPPGPISMASISSIDAVLKPESHEYLYFCAKPDDSGAHAFAETFAAHKVNADRFQAWLNKKGIFETKD